MSQINQLTPEQEAQIPICRDRWQRVSLSTNPIDPAKADVAVRTAYAAMGKPAPTVLFFKGPGDAREKLGQRTVIDFLGQSGAPLLQMPLLVELSAQVRSQLAPDLLSTLVEQLQTQLLDQRSLRLHQATFWNQLAELIEQQQNQDQFGELLFDQLMTQFWEQQQAEWRRQMLQQPGGDVLLQLGDTLGQWVEPLNQTLEQMVWRPLLSQPVVQEWNRGSRWLMGLFSMFGLGFDALRQTAEVVHPGLLDYCISALQCSHDQQKWQALRSLATECSLYLTFEKLCLVLDRPTGLLIDPEERLHAEGEPAVQFADGYQIYFYRDVQLPKRYGALHPHQWQAHWLLEEPNAELRRVLLQGIGYTRLCQELQAVELDSWREYTLLQINQNVDVEPIYLLKMTCPSTGYIHATRVPPDMRTAREAIAWVNWDVDPEDFVLES